MVHFRPALALLALLAVLAVLAAPGAGDEDPATGPAPKAQGPDLERASVDGTLQSLVPANTDVLLYVPSTTALVEKLEGLASLLGEDAAAMADPDAAIESVAGPLAPHLDRAKPMAVALALPAGEGADPVPTLILPVTNVEEALAAFEEAGQETPRTKGAYVVFALGPPAKAPETVPAIAKEVPKGDLVVRVNLERILDRYGEEARAALEEFRTGMSEATTATGTDLSQLTGSMERFARDLIASASLLDVALHVDGAKVHLEGLLTMKEGSPLADAPEPSGDLASMAAALPGDFPIVLLARLDLRELVEWSRPTMDAMVQELPEEEQAAFRDYWSEIMGLYEHVGDRMALGYRFGEDGIEMGAVVTLSDPEQYMKKWQAMVEGGDYLQLLEAMGMPVKTLPSRTVDGHEVHSYAMTLDPEKLMAYNPAMKDAPPEATEASRRMLEAMFGQDGMRWHMAAVDGMLVMASGDEATMDAAIRRAARGGSPTGKLAQALATAGGRPTFLLRLEGRSVLRGALSMAREMMPPEERAGLPTIGEGRPLDLLVHATAGGRRYAGGLWLDLAGLEEIVQAFQEAATTAAGPPRRQGLVPEEIEKPEEEPAAPVPER